MMKIGILLPLMLCYQVGHTQNIDLAFLPQLAGFNNVHQDESKADLSIPFQSGHRRTMSGGKVFIQYEYDLNKEANPGIPYIFEAYETAFEKHNLKKIYREETRGIYSLDYNARKYIIIVEAYLNAAIYSVTILEPEIKTHVDRMFEELEKKGHLAVYINFETGTADIDKRGMKLVHDIYNLMKAKPNLKLSIEGHSDNVGDDSDNKRLSSKRARAVMKTLIDRGIASSRLRAKGWGEEKPIADNSKEKGRHKNRRVELVKF